MLRPTVQEIQGRSELLEKETSYFKPTKSKLYLAENLERPFSVVLHTAGTPVSGRVCVGQQVF